MGVPVARLDPGVAARVAGSGLRMCARLDPGVAARVAGSGLRMCARPSKASNLVVRREHERHAATSPSPTRSRSTPPQWTHDVIGIALIELSCAGSPRTRPRAA
jgi:hypothetical protein